MTNTQTKLVDALTECSVTTLLIDIPVRTAVATFVDLTPLYPVVSAAVEFSTCVAKKTLPACDNGAIGCELAQGAVAYSARARTLGQNIPARAVLGTMNKLAYKTFGAEHIKPIAIEGTEMGFVELIKSDVPKTLLSQGPKAALKSLQASEVLSSLMLGAKVGIGIAACLNFFAKPVLKALATQDEVSGEIVNYEKPHFLYTHTIPIDISASGELVKSDDLIHEEL